MAYALRTEGNDTSSVRYMINLLYHVMHKPECLRDNEGSWRMEQNLGQIYKDVKDILVTPIEIRQAKDVFETPLKQTQDIIEELLEEMPTVKIPRAQMQGTAAMLFKKVNADADTNSIVYPLQEAIKNTFLVESQTESSELSESAKHDFTQFCEEYIQTEEMYQEKLDAIKTLENNSMNESHEEKAKLATEIEELAGLYLYKCIEKQRELSGEALSSPEMRIKLREIAVAEQERINQLLDSEETETTELLPNEGERFFAPTTDSSEQKSWQKTINFANHILITKFQIKLDAKQRRLLTKNDLLKLYFNDDLAIIMEKTSLNPEECQKLRQDIHLCLLLEIQRQQAARLIKALDDLDKELVNASEYVETDTDTITQKPNAIQLANIASIFMNQNLPDAASDPVMMLFQYEENLLLRPRQLEALKNLFETPPDDIHAFRQAVEKVIMGGGKSKVLLPLLAQKKATGLNLVIIEVPPALLATNHTDLNNTSQRLFNQTAHRFEFNRESDCSPKRLEEIYRQFIDIMTNREYLVTTGESMQSLALKSIELLLSPMPTNESERKKHATQIYWAEKIVELLKERGDVIIDEVHEGLLYKRKQNFTMGLPEAIDSVVIRHTMDLYQFIQMLSDAESVEVMDDRSEKNALNLFAAQHKKTINPESVQNQWIEISKDRSKLCQALLRHPSSPLKKHFEKLILSVQPTKHLRQTIIDELTAYLMEEHVPTFLMTAEPTIQNAFAFYKEQLRLLPQTLDRRYKENYGPSKNNSKTDLERTLAIPYSANDKPNERSQFGNPLETLNYTTQALLIEGLNLPLLIQLIEHWKIQARSELQKPLTDEISTEQKVINWINHPDFTSLRLINTKDIPQIEALLKHVHHQPNFLFTLLENNILPQITVEASILHSDSMNHVSIFHTAQAVSGTPDNYMTFHQNLQFDKYASLGTNGYIQQLLKRKNTPIYGVDFTDLKTYLEDLYNNSQKKDATRAIMDICATFRGKPNLEVVQAIANSSFCKISTNPSIKPIKYILYYQTLRNEQGQESDVLYAYDIANRKSIKLDNSNPDEINQKLLNSTPEERFTYYDQVHTTGVDLKQATQSNGLCLVDEKSSIYQGAYRMRGLGEQQTVEIVVPKKMANISLEHLLETMTKNAAEQLKRDIFSATLAKLNNLIREQASEYIRSLDDKDIITKKAWTNTFKHYFIETQTNNLWQQYGAIYHEIDTDKLFELHKNNLIEDWNKTVQKLPKEELQHAKLSTQTIQAGTQKIENSMDEIIKISLPFCHAKSLSPQRNNGLEVEVQQEVQKEQEQELELELEQEQQKEEEAECYAANLHESPYISWSSLAKKMQYSPQSDILWSDLAASPKEFDLRTFYTTLRLSVWNDDSTYAISETPLEMVSLFSDNLLASRNYSKIFDVQQNSLGPLIKPVDAILFEQRLDQTTGQLVITACIISNEELDELTHLLEDHPIEGLWIGTTQHDVLAGTKPDNINIHTNQEYLTLIEQIQFFDGQCKALFEQKKPLYWLSQDTQRKLNFLNKNIIPYRETNTTDFKLLQSKLNQKQVALDYIHQHAANDLTHYFWEEKFPALPAMDITMLQEVALTYKKINQAWDQYLATPRKKKPFLFNIPNESQFPEEVITSLMQYIKKLTSPDLDRTPEDLQDLQRIVSEAVSEYKKQQKITTLGFLNTFHHTPKGIKNAEKLETEVKNATDFYDAETIIDNFLKNYTLIFNSQYNKSSCAHFLLEKLKDTNYIGSHSPCESSCISSGKSTMNR